jgi:hypothetical protein
MKVEFLNRTRRIAGHRTVEFHATVEGHPLVCVVPEEQLHLLNGPPLRSDDEALQVFDQNRTMIEQAAQRNLDRHGLPATDSSGRRELRVIVVSAD